MTVPGTAAALRSPDLARPSPGGPQLLRSPAPGRVLVEGDRVVVAATARGLGLLGSPVA
ncbi:hypothetical protein ACIHEI_04835 [Kitasatospora sp. NPDC051984]|uniref:hypothetical protein n=1 Tax=Kitasatospora sp. NPDC051984 TaxID=3364059 RepID=UPI0037C73279